MGLIVGTLRPMLRLWVRSQLAAVETLEIRVEARDRDFLQGQLQNIELQAIAAVYQGLHLGQVSLFAEEISLQWRPSVQLQAPLVATLRVELTQADLTASLASPLLQSGITDLLANAFGQNPLAGRTVVWERTRLEPGAIALEGQDTYLKLGVTAAGNDLTLAPVRLQWGDRRLETAAVTFDLGDAAIESLDIQRDRLQLRGQIAIQPGVSAAAEAMPDGQTGPSVDSEVSGSR